MNELFQFIATLFLSIYFDPKPVVIEPVTVIKVTEAPKLSDATSNLPFGNITPTDAPVVLGTMTRPTITPTPKPTLTPTPTPIPTPTKKPRKTRKPEYTIALLGDSMMDTLGPTITQLGTIIQQTYKDTTFSIINYGVGGTNIYYGIERITNGYDYLGTQVPALTTIAPDVVVIESFGYNPFPYDTGALDAHWIAMAKAVDTVRTNIPKAKIVIAATIAPNSKVFGDGAPATSFDPIGKWQRVVTIKKYLDNAVKFARSQNLPLADAYTPSIENDGNGKLKYINPGDHIHYSEQGKQFFLQILADTIVTNRLLE